MKRKNEARNALSILAGHLAAYYPSINLPLFSHPPLLTVISSPPPRRLSASPSASSHTHSGSVSSSHTRHYACVSSPFLFSHLPQVLLTRRLRRSYPSPSPMRNPIPKKSRRCFVWARGRYNILVMELALLFQPLALASSGAGPEL